MRIVFVNPYFLPYHGGIERRIHGVARALAEKHDVTVVTARLAGTLPEERMDGFRVVRMHSIHFRVPYNPPLLFTPRVEEAVRALDPDLVDFHYRWAPEYTRAMLRVARDTPVTFTYHNTFGEGAGWLRLPSLLNDALFLPVLRRARAVIAVSEFVRDDLARRGVPRAHSIPNGVDPFPLPRKPAGHILFIGRLVATKGLPLLLHAMTSTPSPPLVVVGDGPERARLEALASRLGITARVTFAGWVPEEEKQRLLAGAEFLVHPALFESFGIAVLEALAAGCPVLATRIGGIPEVVGDAGLLVEPSVGAIAAGLRRMSDGDACKALAAKAKERAALFGWDRIAAETERVFKSAVAE